MSNGYFDPYTLQCLWILSGIYWVVLTPTSLYWTHKFWKLRQSEVPFIMKRHPKFVIFMLLFINIHAAIIRPLTDLLPFYFPISQFNPIISGSTQLSHFGNILFATRMWLLYYDYTNSQASLSYKWKQLILKEEYKHPWSIRHRWLGKTKSLLILATSFMVLYIFIVILGLLIFGRLSLGYTQLIPFLVIIIMFILAFKIRKCKDMFRIQREFYVALVVYIVVIIFYLALTTIYKDPASTERRIVINLIACVAPHTIGFVATFWAVRQCRKQYYKELKSKMGDTTRKFSDSSAFSEMTLEHILATRDGFDLFANHLVKEFSIENLFFIFELVQIKNELLTHRMINRDDIGTMMDIDFHRMDRTKRSKSIIYSMDELKDNIRYIMNQYIYSDAEFCVNISAHSRRDIIDSYEGLLEISRSGITEPAELEMIDVNVPPVNTLDHGHTNIKGIPIGDTSPQISVSVTDRAFKSIAGIPVNRVESLEIEASMGSHTRTPNTPDPEIKIVYKHAERIQDYIRIFDRSMNEIIQLMRKDSLTRFYMTEEYERLSKDRRMSK